MWREVGRHSSSLDAGQVVDRHESCSGYSWRILSLFTAGRHLVQDGFCCLGDVLERRDLTIDGVMVQCEGLSGIGNARDT